MNIYDNVPYKTSSLPKRPPLAWPDGRKVAVCIVISAEYYEMQPPAGSFVPPDLPEDSAGHPAIVQQATGKSARTFENSYLRLTLKGQKYLVHGWRSG
jgi:hypothetical protein